MDSILNQKYINFETEWFNQQTTLVPKYINQVYQIPDSQIENFKLGLTGVGFGFNPRAEVKEKFLIDTIMRNCFKKCNEFVLEDWVDYSELDCTMKCSILTKQAFQILNNREYEK